MRNGLTNKGMALLLCMGFLVGCSNASTSGATELPQPAPTAELKGQIVFAAKMSEKEDYELYMLDVQNGDLQQLTDNNLEDISPDISPDGSKIV